MTDFAGLCRAAREQPGPATHDRLWAAWFALPEWHFIAVPSPYGPLPFSSFIDRQRSVLAFTSAAGADAHARQIRIGPPMPLAPEALIHRLPQLKTYGVQGFLVDIGPDGFFTSLDILWSMFQRFRASPAPAPAEPRVGSIEWFLALPAWHVAMSADRAVPELASHGSDLVAQVYSRPRTATSPMPPAQALALFVDLELVRLVRFDDQMAVDLLELHGLQSR